MIVEQLIGDVRVSIRSLCRSPGFATVVVATLSIGIAAVSALFSAVYSYQYRPLPYLDSDRIVALSESHAQRYVPNVISNDAANAVRDGARSFERVALFRSGFRGYVAGNQAAMANTLWIDSSFATLFALRPQLGRTLTPDEIASRTPSAVISDVLWHSVYGADPNVLGKTLRTGDTLLTIVGVMPEGFRYPVRTDVWRPLVPSDSEAGSMTVLGKLKPGISRQRLAGDLSVIAQRLARTDSQHFANLSFVAGEMVDRGTGPAALRIALLFVGAAAFVLLIACGNVVNLFLVRAAERRGEMAVRASLGASRVRLLILGLTDAVLLSFSAAAIGTSLSLLIIKVVIPIIVPVGLPSWVHFSLDGRILAFTVLVTILVSLAVGVSPALESARPDLMQTLKAGGDRMLSRGGVGKRARAGIVTQLMFSVVLLAGALMFARSYSRLAGVDVGYPARQILRVDWYYGEQGDSVQRRFANELLRGVAGLPGVANVAIREDIGPYSFVERSKSRTDAAREAPDYRLFIDGEWSGTRKNTQTSSPQEIGISEGYFRTLGLRVVAGRGILATDDAGQEKIAVVSRQFAKTFWGSTSPISRTISFGASGEPIRIVGIVEDVREVRSGIRGISADLVDAVYFSESQVSGRRSVIFRGDGDVNALRIPVERLIREIDPARDSRIASLARGIEETQTVSKVFGGLLASFAGSGLILSLIGIYGIVAYGITERTREIGIRLALGGTSGDVMQMIVRSTLRFVAVGLGIGIAMSQGTNRLLGKLVYDISPADPLMYSIICAVFGGVGLLSAYMPARRVSKVDRVIALRAE